jgi:hypothetical protein
MPPRYSYWTIIAGGLPTAFRAADRDELVPTFTRIKHTHPDAEMKWFARGRLWDSPESARREAEAVRRDRDWRPGGDHRDPRQKYKDAKRARNAEHRKRKFERRQRSSTGGASDRRFNRPQGANKEFGGRPRGPRMFQKNSFARQQGPGERPPTPPPDERKEPRPREGTEPTPPPRPSEPVIQPPGPPERGRFKKPGAARGGRGAPRGRRR